MQKVNLDAGLRRHDEFELARCGKRSHAQSKLKRTAMLVLKVK